MIAATTHEWRLDEQGKLVVSPEEKETMRVLLKQEPSWDGTRCAAP